MNRYCWLIIILIVGYCIPAKSQTQPKRPLSDSIYLTIDLNPGHHPTIYWAPPVFDPLYPNPTGYIIYKRIVNAINPLPGLRVPIDTVGPGITSYTDNLSDGNIERLTYCLASLGPTRASEYTSYHSSIFIKSFYDSCYNQLKLSWDTTNYLGWGNRIKKYDVYTSNSPNLASFSLLTSLPGNDPEVTITNVVENSDYYVYVKATKDTTGTGGTPFVTTSNIFYKRTTMPIHPASMSIDSIIAEDKRINIYFKIDPTTGLKKFQVVRWEHPDSIKSIFSRKILHAFSDPTKTFYADTVDNWAARTRPFFYKIDALNTCLRIVKVSNHTNAITPNVLAGKGLKNKIEWDELYIDTAINEHKKDSVKYRVIRYAFRTAPEPPVFLPETDKLELIDDVNDLAGETDPYSIKFCYQIEATETDTVLKVVMFSRSRIQCVEIIPGVTMPDAIIPTDYTSNFGNSRNILVPIITFRADYSISVYNRWGNLIFYGENKGWNGYFSSGELAKEGTYIYRLVVHTLGNRDVIKEGSFVVIYK